MAVQTRDNLAVFTTNPEEATTDDLTKEFTMIVYIVDVDVDVDAAVDPPTHLRTKHQALRYASLPSTKFHNILSCEQPLDAF